MIRLRAYTVFTEIPGKGLGALPARAVNDAAIVRPAADELEQLLVGRRFWYNAVNEIWPVKAGDITPRLPQLQLLHDIGLHPFGSRGSQRDHWHVRKMRPQFLELAVLRPEIVAPFADAMRFVDGELRDVPIKRALQKSFQHQTFRRDVEQSILAAMQTAPARLCLFSIQR